MSHDRPFDDDRWPDLEGRAACFLCGRKVDPRDPNRGTYEIAPSTSRHPIHLPCANKFLATHSVIDLEIAFRKALHESVKRPTPILS